MSTYDDLVTSVTLQLGMGRDDEKLPDADLKDLDKHAKISFFQYLAVFESHANMNRNKCTDPEKQKFYDGMARATNFISHTYRETFNL